MLILCLRSSWHLVMANIYEELMRLWRRLEQLHGHVGATKCQKLLPPWGNSEGLLLSPLLCSALEAELAWCVCKHHMCIDFVVVVSAGIGCRKFPLRYLASYFQFCRTKGQPFHLCCVDLCIFMCKKRKHTSNILNNQHQYTKSPTYSLKTLPFVALPWGKWKWCTKITHTAHASIKSRRPCFPLIWHSPHFCWCRLVYLLTSVWLKGVLTKSLSRGNFETYQTRYSTKQRQEILNITNYLCYSESFT